MSDFKNLDQTRKYDILIGLGFIEYFDEPKKIIKKFYNTIQNGGRLILSFPNANSFDFLKVLQIFLHTNLLHETIVYNLNYMN